MTVSFALSFRSPRFRSKQLSLFLISVACLLLPIAVQAQVTFNGVQPNVNMGSQAVGSPSATVPCLSRLQQARQWAASPC